MIGYSSNIHAAIAPAGLSNQVSQHCGSQGSQWAKEIMTFLNL